MLSYTVNKRYSNCATVQRWCLIAYRDVLSLGLILYTSSCCSGSKWCRRWYGLCMMHLKSGSSIDSASCVWVGVSGEHRPLWMPHCKSARKHWWSLVSCGGKTPPRTYCIREFVNDNRVIDRMYGFFTKSLWTKDSEGMCGLCTSTDNCRNMFTDRQVATHYNSASHCLQHCQQQPCGKPWSIQ